MSRRHPPQLVNPRDVVSAATDRQFGIVPQRSIEQRLAALERQAARNAADLAALLRTGTAAPADVLAAFDATNQGVLVMTPVVKGTVSPTSVTSATGVTIVNGNVGPLLAGVTYIVLAETTMAANADPAGFIYAMVRIEATGTSVDGMQTGTAAGERTLRASAVKEVVGTGVTINISGRARNSAGGLTGSINDAIVSALLIPKNLATIS